VDSDRRDLLKYFAVGTIIQPLFGSDRPSAKLIEQPKVELVEAKAIKGPIDCKMVKELGVILRMQDGTEHKLHGTEVVQGWYPFLNSLPNPGENHILIQPFRFHLHMYPESWSDWSRSDSGAAVLRYVPATFSGKMEEC